MSDFAKLVDVFGCEVMLNGPYLVILSVEGVTRVHYEYPGGTGCFTTQKTPEEILDLIIKTGAAPKEPKR